MSDISYKPLIDDMTWSFSRIETFESCPYRWFLKYIKEREDEKQFLASYGSFMHKLLEEFYKGEITKEEMLEKFICNYRSEVVGRKPSAQIAENYIRDGVEFIKNFSPLPLNIIAVEKRVVFDVRGIPFVGYIDLVGEKDGEIYVIDNKSRNLKPRSARAKPTANDKLLDGMLRQLYIYSEAILQEYGKLPKYLCFNCFRTSTFISEPFNPVEFDKTKEWVVEQISKIAECDFFEKNENYFSCNYICGVNKYCDRW